MAPSSKKPSDSAISGHTHKVFPNDLNSYDTVFGGVVMAMIDRLACVVAERHAGMSVTTASIDALHFIAPAHKGENLITYVSVNRAWRTSMEVGVRVDSENPITGETCHIVSAYMTFVAVDENFCPSPVPSLEPESDLEKRRYIEADERRTQRKLDAKKRAEERAAN